MHTHHSSVIITHTRARSRFQGGAQPPKRRRVDIVCLALYLGGGGGWRIAASRYTYVRIKPREQYQNKSQAVLGAKCSYYDKKTRQWGWFSSSAPADIIINAAADTFFFFQKTTTACIYKKSTPPERCILLLSCMRAGGVSHIKTAEKGRIFRKRVSRGVCWAEGF
jgi:hypothetical protein